LFLAGSQGRESVLNSALLLCCCQERNELLSETNCRVNIECTAASIVGVASLA
jgi:hypothetical protein